MASMDVKEFSEETRDTSPANLLVKIQSFSLLTKHGIRIYESRVFEAGGYKWKLKLYPDGEEDVSEVEGEHVGVYLCVAETSALPVDWEINAICSIFLYNKLSDNYLCFRGKSCRFHAVSSIWGSSKMISKKTLNDPKNGYLVDDNCVFGAEVFVIKSQRVVDCLSLVEDVRPYRREWKISELSKFKDAWTSDDFNIEDHRWRIELCPNGDIHFDDRYVSVFLILVNPVPCHQTVNVSCRFRIKNNLDLTRHYSHKFRGCWLEADEKGYGFPLFMETCELRDPSKGFVVDDCCFLEAKISLLLLDTIMHLLGDPNMFPKYLLNYHQKELASPLATAD